MAMCNIQPNWCIVVAMLLGYFAGRVAEFYGKIIYDELTKKRLKGEEL